MCYFRESATLVPFSLGNNFDAVPQNERRNGTPSQAPKWHIYGSGTAISLWLGRMYQERKLQERANVPKQ
eukprot:4991760-Heterocapsa_arctica.AAC.1